MKAHPLTHGETLHSRCFLPVLLVIFAVIVLIQGMIAGAKIVAPYQPDEDRQPKASDLVPQNFLRPPSNRLLVPSLPAPERGEILHATAGKHHGDQALIKLFSLRGGEFNLNPFERPEERTIHCHWIYLLLEAARQRDEDTVRTNRDRLAFTRSTTNAEKLLDMVAMLADHPQVTEIPLCSKEGRILFNSKCRDHSGRAQVCLNPLGAAKLASTRLPLGEFDQIEIIRPASKTLIFGHREYHLLIHINA
jgi:Domain of unknown function (DUF4388)